MKLVLDTGVLIAGDLAPSGTEAMVASVSFAELAFGIRSPSDAVERATREARLARLREHFGAGLPFDDAAAASFGAMCALAIAAGRNPRSRALDLMIAATAHANDAGVLTRNPDDFAAVRPLVPVVALGARSGAEPPE